VALDGSPARESATEGAVCGGPGRPEKGCVKKGYVIRKADLPALLERFAGACDVYAPVYEDGVPVFGGPEGVAWDFPKTVVPPKEFFLPHTERFLKFRRQGRGYEVQPAGAPAPTVLFGAKPCDMAAVDMLRRVMLEGRFKDEGFEERRNSVIAVAVACETPDRYCFCDAFGLSPGSTRGADLMLYPAGDLMYAVALTGNGERAVGLGGTLFAQASPEEVAGAASRYGSRDGHSAGARTAGSCLTGETVREAAGRMATDFHLPYWEEASERCLSCGICTYLCPTCHCFAVVDRLRGDVGTRSRCWDSCMYSGYSLMAGGHNPRPTRLERVRQRFMHKLVYHPERYGEMLCVGCGRCVEKCPVGLHVASVASELAAATDEAPGGGARMDGVPASGARTGGAGVGGAGCGG